MDDSDCFSTSWHADVQSLLHDIGSEGQRLLSGGHAARSNLITKARSLIATLETPVETVTWIAWAEVCDTILHHHSLKITFRS